jgi:hypothetical protein
MAHQTIDRTAIDQAAATAAATIETPIQTPAETTLAYGAEGEDLKKLVDLLALLGYATNDVLTGASSRLDESVLVDLRAAQTELGAPDGAAWIPASEIGAGVLGELVDSGTWDALYEAAAAKVHPTPADGAQEA